MDVSSMLSNGARTSAEAADSGRMNWQYDMRHTASAYEGHPMTNMYGSGMQRPQRSDIGAATGSEHPRASPNKKEQKHVVFQLIDPEDPRIQARLPMRVMISPHDTTDSIITTVKNFYGVYDYGVSFENKDGYGIIAAYDNFDNDMTVYVRTVAPAPSAKAARNTISPKKPSLGAPFEMRPPTLKVAYSPSRSAARSAGVRSMSPPSDTGRRSGSAAPGGKPKVLRTKSKDNSVVGDADGYTSGENGGGSVTSSRRSKPEQVNADISVDNIVEGGRRKRAFESSELPLFVPPQVPMSASISSISPQRRSGPPHQASPYATNQQTFSYTQPMPSPQSYGSGANYMQNGISANPYTSSGYQQNRALHGRTSYPQRHSSGVLPTPDPTVGSVISDEDVALQLMRLGDPTTFSHGRTSTSTVDDALSGKAELASSGEEDEDDEDGGGNRPAVPRFSEGASRKKQRMNELPSGGTSGEEYEDVRDGTFKHDGAQRKRGKSKTGKSRSMCMGKPEKLASKGHAKVPMSPSSMPTQSRKGSIASNINLQSHIGPGEEDLSSKPRCQRCRKSKKGCDRQRPCGRCKDAGIGAEGCVSEDEGNGRKGRYGRHMGVPVKTDGAAAGMDGMMQQPGVFANGYFLAPALPDKSKKRKR